MYVIDVLSIIDGVRSTATGPVDKYHPADCNTAFIGPVATRHGYRYIEATELVGKQDGKPIYT